MVRLGTLDGGMERYVGIRMREGRVCRLVAWTGDSRDVSMHTLLVLYRVVVGLTYHGDSLSMDDFGDLIPQRLVV